MRAALEFVKTYLITIICGLVTIAAIVVGVIGMSRDDVTRAMKETISKTGASSIQQLIRDPKNPEIIKAEKQRAEMFAKEFEQTKAVAAEINRRQLLMDNVFPKPDKDATAFRFKEEYDRAMKTIHKVLHADTLPTDADIAEEQENVEEMIAQEIERRMESQEDEEQPRVTRRPTGFGRSPLGGGRFARGIGGRMVGAPGAFGGRGMGSPMMPGQPKLDMSLIDRNDPKYDPVLRARVRKARSIYCYYAPGSFHVSSIVEDPGAPPPEQMWYAQVGLWIQDDVVRAIAALNDAAAGRVSGREPCVEDVPVKRVVLLRIRGYEVGGETGELYFPAVGSETPPPPGPSLTGRKCNEEYDVVRFVLVVVIDQREVLKLIDQMSKVNFYQCIKFGYEAVDVEEATAEGYLYGTAPVVQATYEFEGYFRRELFKDWMPKAVRQKLGIATEQ